MSSGSNRLLFSYETSNVYAQDLASLRPSAWLNDNIIAFYMESVRWQGEYAGMVEQDVTLQ